MKFRSAVLLATLAPALYATAAHAESRASASLSIAKIELIDLAPEDGIGPSLEFRGDVSWWPSELTYSFANAEGEVVQRVSQARPWEALTLQRSVGDTLSSTVTLNGSSLATLAASATVQAGGQSGIDTANAGVFGGLDFHLSPHTLMAITFDLGVDSSVGDGKYASSSASVSITDYCEFRICHSRDFALTHVDNADNAGLDRGQAGHQQFTGYVLSYQYGNFFNVSYNVHTAVSPVPEPSTWGMLLAGLGLLGAAARRGRIRA